MGEPTFRKYVFKCLSGCTVTIFAVLAQTDTPQTLPKLPSFLEASLYHSRHYESINPRL